MPLGGDAVLAVDGARAAFSRILEGRSDLAIDRVLKPSEGYLLYYGFIELHR